jgi:F-type H+-transporting ATPase subunit delta
MADLSTLARPYAKAVFEYARDSKQLGLWSKALSTAAAVSTDDVVAKLLDSPTLTAKQKAEVMAKLCANELIEKVNVFISILAGNKRLGLLPVISKLFEQLKAQQEKYSDVRIVSAFGLSSDIEKTVSEKLKKLLLTDISLQTVIDPSLLGGLVMHAGATVIDGSVRGRLNKLAENFDL